MSIDRERAKTNFLYFCEHVLNMKLSPVQKKFAELVDKDMSPEKQFIISHPYLNEARSLYEISREFQKWIKPPSVSKMSVNEQKDESGD